MTVGIRIRDPATGVLRLNADDYTVRAVYSSIIYLSGDGYVDVSGITPDNAGAFLMPTGEFGYWYVKNGQYAVDLPPVMPRPAISIDRVSWTVGVGHVPANWYLLVVRYK